MNRTVLIVVALVVAAVSVSATTVFVMRSNANAIPQRSEEQRLAREKFFGSNKELPPIEKGQEMRPRW